MATPRPSARRLESGAEALLTKPIDFASLRERDRDAARTRGVTATILLVDDEPDLEALVMQKFRRQIRDGAVISCSPATASRRWHAGRATATSTWWSPTSTCRAWTGCRCWQKLQETEEQLSTIIVSAYGDMANIRTAMNRGAFDFLTKPIDFADLEATIDKTLRHIEILREARRRQSAAERAHASLSRYFSPNLAERLASDAGCGRPHRPAARDRLAVHRYRGLHRAGRDARAERARHPCSTNISRA